jgi:hypothetical protein
MRPDLGVFIPIIAMLIGGFVVFSKSEIGRAFAQRLRGGSESDANLLGEVDQLRHEVDGLRAELTQVSERLDFTERLIAQQHTERVGSGSPEPTH